MARVALKLAFASATIYPGLGRNERPAIHPDEKPGQQETCALSIPRPAIVLHPVPSAAMFLH